MRRKTNPSPSGKANSAFLCFSAALIWGLGFVAQSEGMDYVGPYTFQFCRSILATIFLALVALIFDRVQSGPDPKHPVLPTATTQQNWKELLIGGFCCGIFLTAGSILQNIGIIHTTVGKSGFLTALYIVLVPIFGLFLGKKCHFNVWISVALATLGLFLLCITQDFHFYTTDLYLLACAAMFALHILVIDHFSPRVNGVWLSTIQFLFSSVISCILMLIMEKPSVPAIASAGFSIAFAGIFSSAGGYTLQILGQKDLHPSIAALLLSLESVVSVLAGWLILHQVLTRRELFGCVLMFLAVVIVQLDFNTFIKTKKKQEAA